MDSRAWQGTLAATVLHHMQRQQRKSRITISREYPYTHTRQSTNLPAEASAHVPTNLRAILLRTAAPLECVFLLKQLRGQQTASQRTGTTQRTKCEAAAEMKRTGDEYTSPDPTVPGDAETYLVTPTSRPCILSRQSQPKIKHEHYHLRCFIRTRGGKTMVKLQTLDSGTAYMPDRDPTGNRPPQQHSTGKISHLEHVVTLPAALSLTPLPL